jgi:hypothetical protein
VEGEFSIIPILYVKIWSFEDVQKLFNAELETRKLSSLFEIKIMFNDRSCTLNLKISI